MSASTFFDTDALRLGIEARRVTLLTIAGPDGHNMIARQAAVTAWDG